MAACRQSTSRSVMYYLTLWISGSFAIVGLCVVLAVLYSVRRPVEANLGRVAHDLAVEVAGGMSEAVWNMDDRLLAQHFESYPWGILGVTSFRVTTEFGDAIFEREFRDEEQVIKYREPVDYDGQLVGYVEVAVSREPLTRIRRAVGYSAANVALWALLAVLLVCMLAVRGVIVRPVGRTIAGLRRIATGDYVYRLPPAGGREIDAINREVNSMAAEIELRSKRLEEEILERRLVQSDLTALNEVLENRIRERTERLRRLTARLATAQDEEQKRIAEGLHDDVAQLIAAARMKLTSAIKLDVRVEREEALKQVDDLIGQAYDRLRSLSFELASSTLYRHGLKESLGRLCAGMSERYGVSFKLSCAPDEPCEVDEGHGTVLFKSTRELLFNVVKHAGVVAAALILEQQNGNVLLTVEDRGHGFSAAQLDIGAGRGLGLFSIRERLCDIGGGMEIESEPGVLTRIILTVPRRLEERV